MSRAAALKYTLQGPYVNSTGAVHDAVAVVYRPRGMHTHSLKDLKSSFYLNVAIANPSVVCLSATLVLPTQGVEPFGNVSSPLCTLAVLWPLIRAKFYGDRPRGTPP